MCGIAGELRRGAAADEGTVRHQLTQLLHRGPDAIGVYAHGRAAVGQTRLAIIDLVTGDPPMTDEDGVIGAVLNGEIYNYAALRAELGGRHRFSSTGDTEVIAHLAEDLEPVALARRLDGMFALAVWDTRRERLVLARDRVGKKPLYYWDDGEAFVFGSEIKALLAHPAVRADLDVDAIPAYLRFGYVPSPRTMFRGIRSVPPGHVLVLQDGRVTIEPYWAPVAAGMDDVSRLDLDLGEAAAEVLRLLQEAVRRRLVSDVPLGAFLSGGVDSSAIVGLMAAELDRPVQTFTIGFEEAAFDEREWSRLVAERFGTDHHEFVVRPDAVELVERLVWHHDQPFGDSSAIPTYLLSELTRQHVTVALCGDGGDELFAGYERFAAALAAGRLAALPAPARQAVASLASLVPATGRGAKARRFLDAAGHGLPGALRQWVAVTDGVELDRLVDLDGDWSAQDYEAVWASSAGASTLDRLLLLNLRTYLLDDLLPKVDRMSMAHGLEVRAPFLDHELVELAFRLPASAKLRGTTLKRCLKEAVRGLVPDEVLDRPKKGFGVPVDRWFRDDLRAYVDATLGAPDASVLAHVDGTGLRSLITEHQSGRANHGPLLWSLLTLEVFLRGRGW